MIDKLIKKINEKKNSCVVGLDPVFERIPLKFSEIEAVKKFSFGIVKAVHDLVPAIKLQIAFYEKYGAEGFQVYLETIKYAKSKDLIVIGDAKRNDIANTAKAYAEAHFKVFKTDFLTINPFFGLDGINPFADKGIFILVKTSNPSSSDFQDRIIEVSNEEAAEFKKLGVSKITLSKLIALYVNNIAKNYIKHRYSSIGAVVGANHPEQARELRKIMPNSFLLVPGYGAQGATAEDIINMYNDDGYGALINSSRSIIYAYEKHQCDYREAARKATKEMINDINSTLQEAGKLPWKK